MYILYIYLREFMLTTVIMTPGACRTLGRSAQKCTISSSDGFAGFAASAGSISGSIIWVDRNHGFSTFGWENDLRFSYNFDFQCRIYLKVEIAFFEQKSKYWFSGPNLTKSWNTYFHKSWSDFRSPPGGAQRDPQGAQRAPQGVRRAPKDLFRTPILYIQTPDQLQSGRY